MEKQSSIATIYALKFSMVLFWLYRAIGVVLTPIFFVLFYKLYPKIIIEKQRLNNFCWLMLAKAYLQNGNMITSVINRFWFFSNPKQIEFNRRQYFTKHIHCLCVCAQYTEWCVFCWIWLPRFFFLLFRSISNQSNHIAILNILFTVRNIY